MKYLKFYNESINTKEEIEELCTNYLAYLLDDGFKLHIYPTRYNRLSIHLFKNDSDFKWDDIKDIFIPFLEILSSKYEMSDFIKSNNKYNNKTDNIIFTYRNNLTKTNLSNPITETYSLDVKDIINETEIINYKHITQIEIAIVFFKPFADRIYSN